MSNITIYHNPACGTSRNTLEMIRNSGTEPTIIYYLETPPTRDELVKLIADMGISVRALLRKNVEPYEELGLAEDKFTDDRLIDFMPVSYTHLASDHDHYPSVRRAAPPIQKSRTHPAAG